MRVAFSQNQLNLLFVNVLFGLCAIIRVLRRLFQAQAQSRNDNLSRHMQDVEYATLSPQVLEYLKGELAAQSCRYGSATSFLKGFLLGQLSVMLVIALALRYLLMEDVKKVKRVLSCSSASTIL